MSFTDKVVLITGASSGIGAAAAILFTKEGANVAMVGRNQDKLDVVAQECQENGNKPLVINADVSKDEDAMRLIEETIAEFGKLDVLVNNAGFAKTGTILDGGLLESYDEVMATNVRAVINLTVLTAPYLVETKGNIVNISSITSEKNGLSIFNAYSTSKAALDRFSKAAALELAPKGVRVNVVSPGPVATDFMVNIESNDLPEIIFETPLGRIGESEEIADIIAFLASDKARGITGSIYVSDNGMLLQ